MALDLIEQITQRDFQLYREDYTLPFCRETFRLHVEVSESKLETRTYFASSTSSKLMT